MLQAVQPFRSQRRELLPDLGGTKGRQLCREKLSRNGAQGWRSGSHFPAKYSQGKETNFTPHSDRESQGPHATCGFPPSVTEAVARREALLRTFVSVSAGSPGEGAGTEAGQCVEKGLGYSESSNKKLVEFTEENKAPDPGAREVTLGKSCSPFGTAFLFCRLEGAWDASLPPAPRGG